MSLRSLFILSLLMPVTAWADTTLNYSNKAYPGEGTVIQVKDGDVLMGDRASKMLFKQNRKEIFVIDHESRTYMVMDDAAAERLEQQMGDVQQQMNAMMQQMQEQMKNMSEEQRAQLQQMMGSHMQPGAAKKQVETTVQRQGEDTIAGVTCTKLLVLVNGKPSGDVCVASAGVLGIETNDYKAMVSATDAVRQFVQRLSGRIDNDAVSMNLRAMKGIPVRMRDLVDGEISMLESRSTAELDSALFRVPDGYQKRDMPR